MADDGIGGTGYSIEDLSDYLDRGQQPAIAAIDANPECRAVLASLARMGALSRQLVEEESASALDEHWLEGIMREVAREVRAGRDIPLPPPDERTSVVITEGAIRGLLREVGDAVPGVIVERTDIQGDPAAAVTVRIAVSVAFGRRMHDVAEDVRRAAASALERHSGLDVAGIDVTVDSLHGRDEEGEGS